MKLFLKRLFKALILIIMTCVVSVITGAFITEIYRDHVCPPGASCLISPLSGIESYIYWLSFLVVTLLVLLLYVVVFKPLNRVLELKMNRSWIIIKRITLILSIILIFSLSGFMLLGQQIIETSCHVRGGKMVYGDFSKRCEIKAKDAGKSCVYDNECSKHLCIYPTPDCGYNYCNYQSFPKNFEYSEYIINADGHCADYNGDKDGVFYCHRLPGEKVQCDEWVS